MWWFLIYVIIAYLVHAIIYYYSMNYCQIEVPEYLKFIIVLCVSVLISLFWIFIPFGYLIYKIYKFIKK